MERWFWIGLGGAVGTLARYGVSTWCQQRFGAGFPYGTLAVNVIGSFLLGVIMQVAAMSELLSPTVRLGLSTGVMGGFTTYSSFNYETIKLVQDEAGVAGVANVVITVAGCLVAGVMGMMAAKRMLAS
ncbi:fluoride efflux transporter CrcB [Sorangium cellulosum]|uniref:fluoride efflux transporter CrcB n=1 Tax=Sorangium cellulosum TaxID=56 RepID=UPI000CF4FCBB|nr:fluoride efflux transporter CrcB [Sorangium cellulosum]